MSVARQQLAGVSRSVFRCILALIIAAVAFSLVGTARANSLSKPALLNLEFEQKLNAEIPLALSFTNEHADAVQLRNYFDKRPVILVLGYYGCPMLCGLVLNGLVETLQETRATAGKDFDVLFVSIDPHETPSLAAAKKRTYLKRYGHANAEDGWHFLIGRDAEIKTLCTSVGFQFAYDSSLKQYAHPSGIVVLTPEGKVAKYFFGVTYPAAELNAALKDASANRVGSRVQQLLMLCFKHMPLVGKNSTTIMNAVRGLAVVTLLGVFGYVALSVCRERQRRSQPVPVENASP